MSAGETDKIEITIMASTPAGARRLIEELVKNLGPDDLPLPPTDIVPVPEPNPKKTRNPRKAKTDAVQEKDEKDADNYVEKDEAHAQPQEDATVKANDGEPSAPKPKRRKPKPKTETKSKTVETTANEAAENDAPVINNDMTPRDAILRGVERMQKLTADNAEMSPKIGQLQTKYKVKRFDQIPDDLAFQFLKDVELIAQGYDLVV